MKGGEMQQTAGIIEMAPEVRAVAEYEVTETQIAALKQAVFGIEITDKASYEKVRKGLSKVVSWRVAIDIRRKDLNREYVKRNNDTAAKMLGLISEIEDNLRAKKKVVDDAKAAKQAEKARIEAERIGGIKDRILIIQQMAIGVNGQDVASLKNMLMQIEDEELLLPEYEEFQGEARLAIFEITKIIKQATTAREKLDAEQAFQEAEAERLEKIRAEQEEAALALAEAQAKIDAENKRIEQARQQLEAEKQAEINRKKHETLELQLAAEAKVQAEKDAKEKARREEAEKVARERLNEEKALQKAESERLEKARIEQEAEARRLKAENAKIEAAKKAEDARLVKAQAKIDSENQRIEDEKQAEKDAKEKARREEAERVAREEAEAAEKARKKALKPDKEKLNDFAIFLLDITPAEVKEEDAALIAETAIDRIYEIAEWVSQEVRGL